MTNQHSKGFSFVLMHKGEGFFYGCRPFIGLDGCYLRGTYNKVLFTTVTIDNNYRVYLITVAVVENENQYSLGYFLDKLYKQIGCNGGGNLCFMTGRQNEVLIALEKVFPFADKKYCCWHIYANFRLKFLGVIIKNLFWTVTRSGSNVECIDYMDKIKKISELGHKWLNEIPMVHWYKH